MEDPSDWGTLHQFHDYVACLELHPGSPYFPEQAKAVVTLSDTKLRSPTSWEPRPRLSVEQGKFRIEHYIIEKLISILPLPGAHAEFSFTPTDDEVQALQDVDPARVVSAWHTVPQDSPSASGRVFISCGQRTKTKSHWATASRPSSMRRLS